MGGLTKMDQRGITLVELMIAMFLLAIALVGMAAAFPLAMYGVTGGGLQTVATNLAMEVIEQAKRTAYDALETTLDTGGVALDLGPSGYPGFTRRVDVTTYNPGGTYSLSGTPPSAPDPCSTCPCTDCTQVTVTVFFTGQQGEVETTVATVIAAP